MGVGGAVQPWYYFVSHLNDTPSRLRNLFDSMAQSEPSRFSYVLGNLASMFWSQFPQEWKSAILSNHAENSIWVKKAAALREIYSGLFDGDVHTPPPELLDLLWRHLNHNDPEFRTLAGIYALMYWERLSSSFREALYERFRVEPEISVLMGILLDAMNSEKIGPSLDLAEIVLKRSNDVAAAWLMAISDEKNRVNPNAEIGALGERCRIQAGPCARAFEPLDLELDEVVGEPQLIQVAWLWKLVTGSLPYVFPLNVMSVKFSGELPPSSLLRPNRKPPDPLLLAAPVLRDIACKLHGSFAVCAHRILSYYAQKLPPLLRKYLREVENGEVSFTQSEGERAEDISDKVREAIVAGRQEHETEQSVGKESVPAFPINTLGAAWR